MVVLNHLTRRQGDTSYISYDGRYVAIRHYRPSLRGDGRSVWDGWDLLDTWTEVVRHYWRLGDVEQAISDAAARVVFAEVMADRFIGWTAATQTRSGIAEVRLVREQSDTNTALLGLVSLKDAETRAQGVAKLLALADLAHLPEVV